MSKHTEGAGNRPHNGGTRGRKTRAQDLLTFEINTTAHLAEICGSHDRHLAMIEQALDVYVMPQGNTLRIEGARRDCLWAKQVLGELLDRLEQALPVGEAEVAAAIRMAKGSHQGGAMLSSADEQHQIRTKRRVISPRSPVQAAYIEALRSYDLTFGIGPAGTGKTYLAAAVGVSLLVSGQVERIILSRPAVEAGERLGFLPGDLKEKVDPYLRPLYDALHDMMPTDQVARKIESGEIEVAPLAFMRGRTLSNAFVILDEAQNCTPMQVKMFLTRLGENSRMVITGDPTQVDLPKAGPQASVSGLGHALDVLKGVKGIGCVRFTDADVVRHPLVSKIVRAYDEKGDG